jgi:hypothetical protein
MVGYSEVIPTWPSNRLSLSHINGSTPVFHRSSWSDELWLSRLLLFVGAGTPENPCKTVVALMAGVFE